MGLLNAGIFFLCAVIWLAKGIHSLEAAEFIVAAVWMAGSILNLIHYRKDKKKAKEELK